MPLRNWYTANTNHFNLTDSVSIKWKTQPDSVIEPITHDLVRRIRFWRIKSPEHDFKYLHWTISKTLSANLFTCKGTYMTDWVGRLSQPIPLLLIQFASGITVFWKNQHWHGSGIDRTAVRGKSLLPQSSAWRSELVLVLLRVVCKYSVAKAGTCPLLPPCGRSPNHFSVNFFKKTVIPEANRKKGMEIHQARFV